MNKINLNIGDALIELKKIKSSSVDLIIADPPYNLKKNYGNNNDDKEFNEYLNFTNSWMAEAKRVLKKDGTIYVFMGVKFISYLFKILEKDLSLIYNSWITWHYTQGMGKTKGFSPRHDDILVFNKSEDYIFNLDAIRVPQKFYRERNNMRGANPGDVWEFSHIHYSNPNRQNHPTQKPEGLIERLVLASSNEKDLVLDPFFGSGTTARVCQQLNRNFVGIELNPKYKKLTQERLKKKFNGFDSIDPRVKRIPNDLRNPKIRVEYIKKHIKYFLKNHNNTISDFKESVKSKYSLDIDDIGNIVEKKQKKLF